MATNIIRSGNPERPVRSYPASPFRLFEEFFNDWTFRSMEDRAEFWTPALDIMEKEGNLMFMTSLPGMTEKEIEIKVEGQVLTIRGERKSHKDSGYTCHRQESRYGTFSRSIALPDSANPDDIRADHKNGILTISVPQKPEANPSTIKINT